MVKCPDCKREYHEHKKKWKYKDFDVKAYVCECGTILNEYSISGKHSFSLKRSKKDKNWRKLQS